MSGRHTTDGPERIVRATSRRLLDDLTPMSDEWRHELHAGRLHERVVDEHLTEYRELFGDDAEARIVPPCAQRGGY